MYTKVWVKFHIKSVKILKHGMYVSLQNYYNSAYVAMSACQQVVPQLVAIILVL